MNRTKPLSRTVCLALGTAALLAAAGCESMEKEPGAPAYRQACTAEAPTLQTPPIPHDDMTGAAYFGCSNEQNLRAMVDNPSDLEKGRTLGPANGERESTHVEDYRKGKTKSFESGGSSASVLIPNINMGGGQ